MITIETPRDMRVMIETLMMLGRDAKTQGNNVAADFIRSYLVIGTPRDLEHYDSVATAAPKASAAPGQQATPGGKPIAPPPIAPPQPNGGNAQAMPDDLSIPANLRRSAPPPPPKPSKGNGSDGSAPVKIKTPQVAW